MTFIWPLSIDPGLTFTGTKLQRIFIKADHSTYDDSPMDLCNDRQQLQGIVGDEWHNVRSSARSVLDLNSRCTNTNLLSAVQFQELAQ